MDRTFWLILMICLLKCAFTCCDDSQRSNLTENDQTRIRILEKNAAALMPQPWGKSLAINPTMATWSVHTNIPFSSPDSDTDLTYDLDDEERGKKGGIKKKMKKYMLPLLIAYKLKFFTLIPVLIGGLILLTGATGLAGFFFALFAAVMGLKSGHH